MTKYIYLVFLLAVVSGQDTLKLKSTDIYYVGETNEVADTYVKFTAKGDMYPNHIPMEKIAYLKVGQEIVIDDGLPRGEFIEHKLPSNSVIKENEDKGSINLTKLGGLCIALSGGIQYYAIIDAENSIDATIDGDLDAFKEESDSQIQKAKISALLLTIGGILIAIDNM